MANRFQKLFRRQLPVPRLAPSDADLAEYRRQKEEKLAKLHVLVSETLALYNATAAPAPFRVSARLRALIAWITAPLFTPPKPSG